MQKGLRSVQDRHIVLSPERETAARLGKRRDQRPIVLEVLAGVAGDSGLDFYGFGDLYLATEIPPKFIAGPPLSKEDLKTAAAEAEKRQEPREEPMAGGFVLNPERDPDVSRRARGKKERGWKEASRRQRRQKRR
jgi:putative RNA 2'-phosphotransferase